MWRRSGDTTELIPTSESSDPNSALGHLRTRHQKWNSLSQLPSSVRSAPSNLSTMPHCDKLVFSCGEALHSPTPPWTTFLTCVRTRYSEEAETHSHAKQMHVRHFGSARTLHQSDHHREQRGQRAHRALRNRDRDTDGPDRRRPSKRRQSLSRTRMPLWVLSDPRES